MDLVGAWLRQLLKAGTAAALVPVAMVAALGVALVGAGGFGGLGALGQVLSGPQISPAERLAASDRTGGRDVAPVAPAEVRESVPARRRAATRRRTPGPAATRPPRRRATVDPQNPPRVRPPPPPVLVAPPPAAPPPPPAARRPTLKERTRALGDKLRNTVGKVGAAVQEVVEALGETLGRIVDPPPIPLP